MAKGNGGKKKGKRLANPPNDKATKAVEGQLATAADMIGRQLGKQTRKLDRQTERTLASMNKLVSAQRESTKRLGAAALAEQRSYGVAGGVSDQRVAMNRAIGKVADSAATSQTKSAKANRKAALGAMNHAHRSASRMNKNSMSLLNVLAHQYESQFDHDILMAQMQFDSSAALAGLQAKYNKEYLDYQYEQGYALRPEEQAALNWEYREKEINKTLEAKLLKEKEAKDETVTQPVQAMTSNLMSMAGEAQNQYYSRLASEGLRKGEEVGLENTEVTRDNIIAAVMQYQPEELLPQASLIVDTIMAEQGAAGVIDSVSEAVTGTNDIKKVVEKALVDRDLSGATSKFIEDNRKVFDGFLDKAWAISVAPNEPTIRSYAESINSPESNPPSGMGKWFKDVATAGPVPAAANIAGAAIGPFLNNPVDRAKELAIQGPGIAPIAWITEAASNVLGVYNPSPYGK